MKLQNVTGRYHNCSPILSDNADVLICACGSSIKQLSSKTGELISAFHGHNYPVTCIAVDPKISSIVYSASIDGTLIRWNKKTNVVDKKWNLNAPIFNILVSYSKHSEIYIVLGNNYENESVETDEEIADDENTDLVAASERMSNISTAIASSSSFVQYMLSSSKEKYKMCVFNLKTGVVTKKITKLYLPFNSACLTVFNNCEYLLTINRRKLFLWNISSESFYGYKVIAEIPHSITCISASFTYDVTKVQKEVNGVYSNNMKSIVVTGHENGEILVWHDLSMWITRQPITTFAVDPETKKKIKNVTLPATFQEGSSAAERKAFIENTPPICTLFHWHAHAVVSVAVSVDSRYVYSGGEEGVLVVWQVENPYKSFLPRLGSSIAAITANVIDTRVVVTTNDNTIRIVNTTSMKDEWTLKSVHVGSYQNYRSMEADSKSVNPFEPLLSDTSTYNCNLTIEPRTNYVVGNGIPYILQFYDVSSIGNSLGWNGGKYRATHEVVPYQRISKTEKYTKMYIPTVTMYAFGRYKVFKAVKNRTGGNKDKPSLGSTTTMIPYYDDYLATVDVRRGEEMLPETSLKIWKFDTNSASYKLILQVDRPHDASKITSLCFTPDTHGDWTAADSSNSNAFIGVLTAASNGSSKFWYCNDASAMSAISGKEISEVNMSVAMVTSANTAINSSASWKCLYAHKYKEHPVYASCFSRDASLLCLAHHNLVSLWDPLT